MDTERGPLLTIHEASVFRGQRRSPPVYGSLRDSSRDGQHSPDINLSIDLNSSRPAALNVIGLSYVVKERPGQWWNGSCFRQARAKHVLQNLNMTFIQGELTALVGSSGSGKTSLLDVISCRAQGKTNGLVTYRHEQCTRQMMKQKCSYVLQADRLLPTLTVRETFTYMAYLKLPGYMSDTEIDAKVQSVIDDMGLRHVAETRIGGAVVRGVSGGERRRITIGVQLLKDPEILLLDEPTSGLDAFTARHLVSSLAELAHKGKLVIMTIHQPRSDIFNLLDKVAILTVGQLAYMGRPDQLVPYFTSIGHPCPRDQNPCDVYIDKTSVDRRTAEEEQSSMRKAQRLCQMFANSELQANIVRNITLSLSTNPNNTTTTNNNIYKSTETTSDGWREKPSWPRKFQCLLIRMNVHLWRDRPAFLGRLMFLPAFIPFILIFLGHMDLNQGSIQDRLGMIYQSTQVTPYMGILNCVAVFPPLRDLFYRETYDGLYSSFTFIVTYWFHCLPFNICACALFCPILYWIAGFNSDLVAFGCYILVCVVLIQFGEMMAVSILTLIRNSELANNSACLVFSASALVSSGLLRNLENMPQLIQWFGYIAIHKYTTEILVANEFHKLHFDCERQGQSCLTTGDDFLRLYYPGSLVHENRNFGLMGGYSVAIIILALMFIKARGIPIMH